ncbi:sigma 54-interacting transcriptional regulator [Clostridium fungisolvens]|uniref:Anaerobic nitric oxide reductase transcription regulator NorR n=1 Tax=Clostridium fungisolvens TaxID=1604897 RepID=A0A6V8SPT1_9CLOT|nr:sigma 54-interacting transcriptional regulator [Clostridium fungisolvens]GFP77228.1 Anaerobic nitric oxide reductase transcription regulator NorR [Clostridium fungisolvens]
MMKESLSLSNFNEMKIILDNIFNEIIIVDNSNKIFFINESASILFGLDCKSSLGKDINKLIQDSELSYFLSTKKEEVKKPIVINELSLILNVIPIYNGENLEGTILIFNNITNYNELLHKLDEEKNSSEILNTVIETAYDGMVIIDKNGIITMMSKAYKDFLGIKSEDVIGKHVTEVIENTRMPIVLETGKEEVAQLHRIKGNYMIASRIPIIKNGEVIGVVGKVLFRNVKELNSLYKKISAIEKELANYKSRFKEFNTASYSLENIIGESEAICSAKAIVKKAAHTSSNVLILGESGTGKEIFAHAIHSESSRYEGPFVKVNCAAIPSDLLESELFGYEAGAFTGARKEGKIGKFEIANEGTIFLDEIGDMPLHMQVKLLRVIQEREVEKIGGVATRKINIRIIAATNRNLERLVSEGKFREDLYYRLNVVTIEIPPLRERGNDIILISNHLIKKLSVSLDKKVKGMTKEAEQYLKTYEWKGNVRELENMLERAINIMGDSDVIGVDDLPKEITGKKTSIIPKKLQDILEESEKNAIILALRAADGNKTKAAKILDIGRTSLYEKIEKYKIEK